MTKHLETLLRLVCLFLSITLGSECLLAQGARVRAQKTDTSEPANSQIAPDHDSDGDHPQAREEWFRSGRQVLGDHAADLLHRGYQQKRAMAAQEAQGPQILGPDRKTASGIPFTGGTFAGTWTNLGPAPITSDPNQDYGAVVGRVTSIAVDPGDTTGNTVYVGAAFGGAWKSTNAASSDPTQVTWTPLIDNQPTLAVGAITVQPGNSNVVLIGTGEPNSSGDSYYGMGILRSTDGGSTWTLIRSTSDNTKTFSGLGASSFAWATSGPANGTVVVGIGSTNGIRFGTPVEGGGRGIYYSKDAGASWLYATVTDSGSQLSEGTVTSIVFNPGTQKFYAAYRYHGFYESSDGITWTRSSSQPDATGSLTIANCPTSQPVANPTGACPLYRGQLAVQPTTNDMYVIYVDPNDRDEGVYTTKFSSNTGTLGTWTQLRSGPCKDPQQPGCPAGNNAIWTPSTDNPTGVTPGNPGIEEVLSANSAGVLIQGDYNLWIGAIPTASGTDLLVGTRNIYKCSLSGASPACEAAGAWLDLTHVYTCGQVGLPIANPSHMHPDQHGFDFNLKNPQLMYFGNDGGVYRSVNGAAGTGTCTSANPFQNLDTNIGSLSEMVSFSQHPTNQNILLGGLQDNGSPALLNNTTNKQWQIVNGGDGGYNEIDPKNPDNIWYSENTGVSVQQCNTAAGGIGITSTLQCTPDKFGSPPYPSSFPNIGPTQVQNDTAEFYMPFTLDPNTTANVVLGTCRIWRGPGVGSSTWISSAVSGPVFDSSATACVDGTTKIRALAVGGPAGVNGASSVMYAGLEGANTVADSGGLLGHVWVNTQADTNLNIKGTTGWVDVTGNINPGVAGGLSAGGFGPFPISDIEIDPHDSIGQTAYLTVEGFQGVQGTGHVFKTINAGANWTDITHNLPDVPTDSIAIDPDSSGTLYIGTDVGAFVTTDGGNNWQILGTNLPNVPVTRIRVFGSNAAQPKLLRVSTYGRGVWQFSVPIPPPVGTSPALLSFGTQLVKTSTTQPVTVTNNSSSPLTFGTVGVLNGTDFTISNNGCPTTPNTLAAGASCAIQITFNPQTAGQQTNTLTLNDNGSNSPQTVSVSGTGIAPALGIAPASLTFVGSVQNGTASQTATVTNTGTAGATIATITVAGAGYTRSGGTCSQGLVLAQGASCTVSIVFTAPVAGQAPGTLTVIDTSGDSQSINLNGTGTDFNVAAGASGASVSVNAGQTATFNISLTPVDNFIGTVNLTCSSGAPPAASCSFSPSAAASVSGTTPTAVTLNVTTTAHSAVEPGPAAPTTNPQPPLVRYFIVLLLALTITALLTKPRLRPLPVYLRAMTLAGILGATMLVPACGGGGGGGGSNNPTPTPNPNTGTAAGTYTIVVTATSGNLSHLVQLTLTVH